MPFLFHHSLSATSIHLLEECEEIHRRRFQLLFTVPPKQALQLGRERYFCSEMSPASAAERATCQHPLHLCLRPTVLEGNNWLLLSCWSDLFEH